MSLSATRIRPGTYTVAVAGLEISLARSGGSWQVWDRTATWDREGFALKRDAMAYLEEVQRGHEEASAWEVRLRQQELAKTDHQYVWIEGFALDSAESRGSALRAIFNNGARPAWVGQAQSPTHGKVDLVHWRGDREDLDRETLGAFGAQVVAEGRSVELLAP